MAKEIERQTAVITAIDQYIDRHSLIQGEHGLLDLTTLENYQADSLYEAFKSSIENGLTTAQVKENEQKFGKNQYKRRKKKGLFEIFQEAMCDEMLIILIIAACVSIIVEYFSVEDDGMFWVDGVSIMIAVLVCTLVGTISNYQKEKQFVELDEMAENTYNYEVIRNGQRQEIHRADIVPGDMIFLSNGMEIPADCIIYKAINVIVNESAITGETNEVYKNTLDKCLDHRMDQHAPSPLLVSGSNIVSGEGIMMAAVVGKDSRAGKNFQLIFSSQDEEDDIETPLQEQLSSLASEIGKFGIAASIIILIVLVGRLLFEEITKGDFKITEHLEKLVQYVIISIVVIVVAIPEGLPLAVTLTLAYSMKSMYNDKILVRKLESCETMGAAKYLCSDKTGTITQNKMNVKSIVNIDTFKVEEFTASILDSDYLSKLSSAIFHNTSAIVAVSKGGQTEIAMIKLATKLTGKDEEKVRKEIGSDAYFKRLPFDSSRKRMTTGLSVDGEDYLFMNGASEYILEACESIKNYKTGEIIEINKEIRKKLVDDLDEMANKGYRTLSVSYKPVDREEIEKGKHEEISKVEEIEKNGFILLGIFGIEDPPREESREAIKNCEKAGINVIMVTGDNKITAANIAHQVGIVKEDKGRIIEASEFMKELESKGLLKSIEKDSHNHSINKIELETNEEKKIFSEIIEGLSVMARSKPEHKYILVDGINQLGHVVGVTGDGANDAPALVRADIGLAMGITGTQVAKNASDIIILDDNFNSIVRAVVCGRNVYTSIRKFLQFQLTVNVIAVCMVLISASIIRQSILTSVQMLWVNLIMDSLAALALATEPPDDKELLNQKPNSPSEQLITKTMLKHIVGQVIFQLFILNFILFYGSSFIPEYKDSFDDVIGIDLEAKYNEGIVESTVTDGRFYRISGDDLYKIWYDKYENYSRHFTFFFNAFVFLQVFNFICCRRIKDEINILDKIFSNVLFWGIVVAIVLLQILIISFGGRFFQFYKYGGLTIAQWMLSIGFGALTVPVSLFLRILPFYKPKDNFIVNDSGLRVKSMKLITKEDTYRKFEEEKI